MEEPQRRARRLSPSGLLRRADTRAGLDSAADPLVAAHRAFFPKADDQLLRRAYAVAERYHRGQLRKSGAPYVTHPLAVAVLLAELGMDTTTLVAALLHDTVEDTELTLGQVHADFGEEVAVLVDGVTKLDGSKWGDRAEAETFRKMILAASDDLRVLVIKLADRVHNMRTLRFHPKRAKRERIARATLELLVPFAERLGVFVFKRELEDLAFANLQPEAYATTKDALAGNVTDRAEQLAPLLDRLRAELDGARLPAEIVVRDRHVYSIYHRRRNDPLAAHSVVRAAEASRITVLIDGGEADCYVALGVIHGLWHPVPGRMKDFIAMPKYNMYRSLHTSVISPDGDMLQVMIRTPEMHRTAEYGIITQITDAARASSADAREAAHRGDLAWLRNLLAWQGHAASAEFLDSLRVDLRSGGIVVFTPTGDVVPLPRRATAVDFAYALEPEIGNTAIGALVNGRLSQLSAPLDDGQVVEVLTAPEAGAGPSREWLEIATTGHARVHIQRWLAERRTETAGLVGRRLVADALAAGDLNLLELEGNGIVLAAARELGHHDLDDLYAAVASAAITVDDLTERLRH